MTNRISNVLAVGCRRLPSWVLDTAVGVKVAVAMAVVVDKTSENDCATAIACGVAFSVEPTLFMLADDRSLLERASVTGDSSLPCPDRVIVTKEVTGDRANGLEDMMIELDAELIELVKTTEVFVACIEGIEGSFNRDGVDVGLSMGGGGGDCRAGNTGAGGVGAGGGASSPKIGFAWFCPGRGRFTVMTGAPDAVRVAAATENAGFGTSPIFEVSWLIPGRV